MTTLSRQNFFIHVICVVAFLLLRLYIAPFLDKSKSKRTNSTCFKYQTNFFGWLVAFGALLFHHSQQLDPSFVYNQSTCAAFLVNPLYRVLSKQNSRLMIWDTTPLFKCRDVFFVPVTLGCVQLRLVDARFILSVNMARSFS